MANPSSNHFSFLKQPASLLFLSLWLLVVLATSVFIGLRPDHYMLFGLVLAFFCLCRFTRRLLMALLPFVLFALSYDWMRVFPNYLVNSIDTEQLFRLEQRLFGISTADGLLIPNQWFALHHCTLADAVAGICYLCWVPGPIAFALWLYFKGEYQWCTRFTWTFLLVNLIGFAGYYVHPAAPPWYVLQYGFTPVLDTPGNVGGLIRFDQLVGAPVFQSIYVNNSNVFAAMPSLHSAYLLVTSAYALMSRQRWPLTLACILLCVGIWFAAVYSGHHYLLDVLAGILTALLGVALGEWLYRRTGVGQRFVEGYSVLMGRPAQEQKR